MEIKIKYLLFLATFLLFVNCSEKKRSDDQPGKPNILFFLVDDQRNDILGCAGHPIIKTPTVDKLAKNGVRFTNAFVTTSICMASRATIFTGLYETKHDYFNVGRTIKDEYMDNAYPYLLKQAGYNTGFVGKLGFNFKNKQKRLAEMFDFFKISSQNAPHFIEQPDGSMRHSAEVWGDNAVEFIRNQSDANPFYLTVNFNSVHAVDKNHEPGLGHYPYPKAVEKMYEDIEMPKPDLSDPEIFVRHPDFMKKSINRERYFWRWDTEEKYQTNLRAYFRMISGYDNVMKRVIDVLKEKGLDDNTVVIFSADNGYYMGNRGFAGKWTHYEESLRVPMIIYDPRLPKESVGRINKDMVLNVDIPSTILDLAGTAPPEDYQGRSFLPLVNNNRVTDWRKDFLCEFRRDTKGLNPFVCVRSKRYVYTSYYGQETPYEFLHDLKTDPFQLENFAMNDKYMEILNKMRERCSKLEENLK